MEWLRKLRTDARKTQEEVAEATGIAQSAYANIESGRRAPSVKTAKRIAAALGFDWQRFYEDPPEQKETPA